LKNHNQILINNDEFVDDKNIVFGSSVLESDDKDFILVGKNF
jgi:hypothetical protein